LSKLKKGTSKKKKLTAKKSDAADAADVADAEVDAALDLGGDGAADMELDEARSVRQPQYPPPSAQCLICLAAPVCGSVLVVAGLQTIVRLKRKNGSVFFCTQQVSG
jgi:hypothetical protein